MSGESGEQMGDGGAGVGEGAERERMRAACV